MHVNDYDNVNVFALCIDLLQFKYGLATANRCTYTLL